MSYTKFLRRARNAQWAYRCLHGAVEGGHTRSASRAAAMIVALENWLDHNGPSDVTTYNDHE